MPNYFTIDATDAAELNTLLFSDTQDKLNQQLHSFAEHFDTCSVTTDSLAKTYAALTGCSSRIAKHEKQIEPEISQSLAQTQQLLDQAHKLNTKATCKKLEERKDAYLKEKQSRQKDMLNELRKESDQLDEHYAKKTRESIYKNLVGANHWSSIK